MKFVIEHLSKSFERKYVLKDISFTFEEGEDLRTSRQKRGGEDHVVQLPESGS